MSPNALIQHEIPSIVSQAPIVDDAVRNLGKCDHLPDPRAAFDALAGVISPAQQAEIKGAFDIADTGTNAIGSKNVRAPTPDQPKTSIA